MKNLYDEDYYERGIENGVSCYTNYRWLPELTIPMAATMIEYLGIDMGDRILDFGCAKGYLVKAFRLLHREAYGFDISDYARENAHDDIRKYVSNDLRMWGGMDWVISKDVFEHISYEEIDKWISDLSKISKNAFVIVPLGENGRYIVPAYELDATHIIRENLEWWKKKLEENGFHVKSAEYKVPFIKENWNKWEYGNGFFVAETQVKNLF